MDLACVTYHNARNIECEVLPGTHRPEGLSGFGFDVRFEKIEKTIQSPVKSAFLKANTRKQLVVIETGDEIVKAIPKGQLLKIKLEVDTDPPPGFETQTRYLLQPIPFAVRAFVLPDLFAGKMHAVLCRRWKNRGLDGRYTLNFRKIS